MGKCEDCKCEDPGTCESGDCGCGGDDEKESEEVDPLPHVSVKKSGLDLAVDHENADYYAFSSMDLRQLRKAAVSLRKEEPITSLLDWDPKAIALQVIGDKLDG